MAKIETSYLPAHVLKSIRDTPIAELVGAEQRMDVVTLFADVSGFTAISEALGNTGKSGTEELTTILNSYFEPMIDLIRTYGGIIGKFGGDAMTVIFPYSQKTIGIVTRRAMQCAFDMQRDMVNYEDMDTSAGQFSLAMKAGLAMGRILCMTVGVPSKRLEYILAGEAIDLCADAEHHADKGDVVVHQPLLAHAGAVEIITTTGDFAKVKALINNEPPILPDAPITLTEAQLQTVRQYLPPTIVDRILMQLSTFIAEHRIVTILFVSFSGFDYDNDAETGHKLQTYLAAVIDIIGRYDGTLNKIDMGDKGSKYIILFGAPLSHEDDEKRALNCALAISELETPSRIGINTGFVYSGQVGSKIRQEYTVMGDAVNLAARLMQAAQPREIVISSHTHHRIQNDFVWSTPQQIMVKGKSEPITVYRALAANKQLNINLHQIKYDYPIVGRAAEQQIAREMLQSAADGVGRILGVSGVAGAGKSRLTARLIQIASEKNFAIYGGECESYGTDISYMVWRGVWRGIFNLDANASPGEQIIHLHRELRQIKPSYVQRAPLLSSVLNLSIPDNAITRNLDGKLRLDLAFSLLLDCLVSVARRKPVMLILEDCHWMDGLSQQLAVFLSRNCADLPIFILMIYRPEGAITQETPIREVFDYRHFHQIMLEELTEQETEQLIALKLKALLGHKMTIPANLQQQIAEKAQGNPFYVEEIINYIHDRGQDFSQIEQITLPDSLHSLIISRIDTLSEAEKTTVKVAGVIGRFFRANWIWNAYPPAGTALEVENHLNKLSRVDITPLHQQEPEYEYFFKHITTHEVAYTSMTFATREMLHEAIAKFVENKLIAAQNQYVDTLAHHYGHSANITKKRQYWLLAGEAAQTNFANDAAINYYRAVLPLIQEAEKSRVLLKLGEVLQLIGEWSDAEALFRQSLNIAIQNGDQIIEARARNALGLLLADTESPEIGTQWLNEALLQFETQQDQNGISSTRQNLGLLALRQGQHGSAREHFNRLLETNNVQSQVEAYLSLGWVNAETGDPAQAMDALQHALEMAESINYLKGSIAANSDMAGLYFMQGDYAQALHYCQAALDIAEEIGYLQAIGSVIGNAGEIYRLVGDFNHAISCTMEGLSIAARNGDKRNMMFSLGSLGHIFNAQDNLKKARHLLTQAAIYSAELNAPYQRCEYLQALAEIKFQIGDDLKSTATTNTEALNIAEEVSNMEILFKAKVLAIRLGIATDIITIKAAEDALKQIAADYDEPPQQAHLYYHLWQITQKTTYQKKAATLCKAVYAETTSIEFKRAYETITGKSLSGHAKLPMIIRHDVINIEQLDDLLARVLN